MVTTHTPTIRHTATPLPTVTRRQTAMRLLMAMRRRATTLPRHSNSLRQPNPGTTATIRRVIIPTFNPAAAGGVRFRQLRRARHPPSRHNDFFSVAMGRGRQFPHLARRAYRLHSPQAAANAGDRTTLNEGNPTLLPMFLAHRQQGAVGLTSASCCRRRSSRKCLRAHRSRKPCPCRWSRCRRRNG
jgi:hypothetical protein